MVGVASQVGLLTCQLLPQSPSGFVLCFQDHARMRDAPDSYVGIVCHSAPSATGFQAARKLGRDLAVAMTAAGAGDILRAAKQATREEIVANHAKRKPEASPPVVSLPSDKVMSIGEGENSYRQCGSQSPT